MAWEVEYTDEFGNWWDSLDEPTQDAITKSVTELEIHGP
jgi:hypothetical protein